MSEPLWGFLSSIRPILFTTYIECPFNINYPSLSTYLVSSKLNVPCIQHGPCFPDSSYNDPDPSPLSWVISQVDEKRAVMMCPTALCFLLPKHWYFIFTADCELNGGQLLEEFLHVGPPVYFGCWKPRGYNGTDIKSEYAYSSSPLRR